MNLKLRSTLRGKMQNVLIYVLTLLTITLFICIINFYDTTQEQHNYIEVLCATVNEQTAENNKLKSEAEDLSNDISQLKEENTRLKSQIKKDQKTIDNYKKQLSNTNDISVSDFGLFKSYTDYNMLDRNSAQWKLQKKAYTDENGLRKIGNAYLVAMGSYYSTELGTYYTVTLSNGNSFEIILCDCKKDIHTDSKNQVCLSNGSILEFYVDENALPQEVKTMGTIGAIPFFSGSIVNITKKN